MNHQVQNRTASQGVVRTTNQFKTADVQSYDEHDDRVDAKFKSDMNTIGAIVLYTFFGALAVSAIAVIVRVAFEFISWVITT